MSDDFTPGQDAGRRYYQSGSASALRAGPAVGDGHGRPGGRPATPADPPQVFMDNDADRYYANGGSRAQRAATPGRDPDPRVNRVRADDAAYGVARPVRVDGRSGLNAAVEAVVAGLAAGEPRVYVDVAGPALEADLLTGLELAAARGRVAEDRIRRVAVRVLAADAGGADVAKATLGAVAADAAPPAPEVEVIMPEEFARFVAGDGAAAADVDDGTD